MLRNKGLTDALLLMFSFPTAAMALTGWRAHNTFLAEHGSVPFGLARYPGRGDAGPVASVPAGSTLTDKPLPLTAVHLCVDMQRLFGPATDWSLPWMPRVLPEIVRLCELGPERTIFTRFIPARRPGEGQGTWREGSRALGLDDRRAHRRRKWWS